MRLALFLLALPLSIAAGNQHEGLGPHNYRRSQFSSSQAASSSSVLSSTFPSSSASKSSSSAVAHSTFTSSSNSIPPKSASVSSSATPTPTAFAATPVVAAASSSSCASSYTGARMITGTGTLPKPTSFVTKAANNNQLMLDGKKFTIVGPSGDLGSWERGKDMAADAITCVRYLLDLSRRGYIGAEGYPPATWTNEATSQIQTMDKNHLIMDGTNGIYNYTTKETAPGLGIQATQVMSDHGSPGAPSAPACPHISFPPFTFQRFSNMRCPDAFYFIPRTRPSVAAKHLPTTVFLLGAGYIGGAILQELIDSDCYSISVLVRNKDQAAYLRKMGVTAVLADLDSTAVIRRATTRSDIILHTAASDHLPSIAAVLDGLRDKRSSSTPAVFLHLSGTGAIMDQSDGTETSDFIYSDKRPDQIDARPEGSGHKAAHVLISNAVRKGKVGSAKVAIVMPPLIYGVGKGPFNKLSSQIPGLMRRSIADGHVSIVGSGANILNLTSFYLHLISHLRTSSPPNNLFWFTETSSTTFLSLSLAVHSLLSSKGLVDSEPKSIHQYNTLFSNNARSRAERLRELGWTASETAETVREAMEGRMRIVTINKYALGQRRSEKTTHSKNEVPEQSFESLYGPVFIAEAADEVALGFAEELLAFALETDEAKEAAELAEDLDSRALEEEDLAAGVEECTAFCDSVATTSGELRRSTYLQEKLTFDARYRDHQYE
ncbi:hypothetical protein P7C70_g2685, partial [Phenoliferia sp. Uapishka_3]